MSEQITRQDLRRLIDGFEHTAYRLELLPAYSDPSEETPLRAFTEGREPEVYPGKRVWVETVRQAAAEGRVMERVHVVSEPLSEYLRYEIGWSYVLNASAGERIRIMPLAAADVPPGMARLGDYWLFDSRTMVSMGYSEDGRLTKITLVSDPTTIVAANYWRDAARHAAVPLDEYIGARGHELQRAS
jgi:hypothetical protein